MEILSNKIKKYQNISLVMMIFFNIYGSLLENIFFIPRQALLIIPILILTISLFLEIYYRGQLKINRFSFYIFLIGCLIIILQVIILNNYSSFKQLLYLCIFFLISLSTNKDTVNSLSKSLIILTILMCIEALYYYFLLMSWGWETYNVRHFTIAPKEDYTLLLSLGYVILLFSIPIYSKKSKKVLIFFLAMFELFVNIFVMQSKTALIVVAFSIFVFYYKIPKKIRKRIFYVLLFSIILMFLILVSFQNILPDFIYVLINQYTGLFASRVEQIQNIEKLVGTYDQRNAIYLFCSQLFFSHFFIGIGFGNFGNYSTLSDNPYINTIIQPESGIIGSFVEGGIIYGILYVSMVLYPIIISLKRIRDNPTSLKYYKYCLLSITMAICCILNDCQSVTFWTIMGILISGEINGIKDHYVYVDCIWVKKLIKKVVN